MQGCGGWKFAESDRPTEVKLSGVRMSDIFLSYANEDREYARQLAESLAARRWSVWWDRKLPPGETWAEFIQRKLAEAECVLVLWSSSSIESDWVKKEARFALHRNILIPVLIEPVEPPFEFEHIQAADLINRRDDKQNEGFEELISAIGARTRLSVHRDGLSNPLPPRKTRPRQTLTPAKSARIRGLVVGATVGLLCALLGMGVIANFRGDDLLIAGVPTALAAGVVGLICADRRNRIRGALVGGAIGAVLGPVALFLQDVVSGVSSPGLPRGDELPGSALYGMVIGAFIGALYGRHRERR